ncbi:hypothetical protein [Mangrovimonas sp. YM274]|uniref:hypothetical protein n=1 Tax=Mangrovimonas sp. YM274 TaxID=3070660 RepID=UPI0027DD4699|nr:hypothetical protein [Mangrovimonas sp. YM274]WMI68242.1 hypothetical protein RBH95_13965 [Mangrovimonas sp. YM274]
MKNKQNYFKALIIVEILVIISLFYFNVNLFLSILLTSILLIDIYSNKRCLNRQKNFIKSVEFKDGKIICTHLKNNQTIIPFEKLKFSIREKKFEKDKTEIEIKLKKSLKSKLIGRLHINNWSNVFDLKNEFLKNSITQIKYRPEGFWSKYGLLTADIVITGTALAGSTLSEISGELSTSNNLDSLFMPLSQIKEDINTKNKKASR